MDSFSDKLKTVLSDPESMEKIAQIAKGFAASAPSGASVPQNPSFSPDRGETPEEPVSGALPSPAFANGPYGENGAGGVGELLRSPAIAGALKLLNEGSRERVALLQAMRPFVREEKKAKLDNILQTMKMLDLISSAQKLL